MKQFIGLAFASAIVVNVNAQSAADGLRYLQYGKYQSAVDAMKKIADNNAEAAYVLGLAELKLENYVGAKNAFSKHPTDYRSLAGQAILLYHDNKAAEAEKILQTIVDKAKKKEWEKYKVAADAMSYTKNGNISKAIEWYKKAIEINPEDADIYIGLGDAYQFRVKDAYGDAMTQYENAETKSNNKSLANSKIGALWIRGRNYENALDNFTKAKNVDPNNPLPYKHLANAYYRSGQFKYALENIEKYYSLSDKNTSDKIDYANTLIMSKEYSKAETVLNELFAAKVEEPTLHRAMAYSQYETKKYQEAQKSMDIYFNTTKDASKFTADDYLYSGKIYAALSQEDTVNAEKYLLDAETAFEKALTLVEEKDHKKTRSDIAGIYKDAGSFAHAGKWYGKLVEGNAEATEYEYFDYGLYTYYGKQPEKALEIFTAMREKFPEQGSAYYWQARSAELLDSKADKGTAEKYYLDWLAFNKEGYTPKDTDKVRAYQYLSYYYYNVKKHNDAKVYVNKIIEIDKDNSYAKSMLDYYSKLK